MPLRLTCQSQANSRRRFSGIFVGGFWHSIKFNSNKRTRNSTRIPVRGAWTSMCVRWCMCVCVWCVQVISIYRENVVICIRCVCRQRRCLFHFEFSAELPWLKNGIYSIRGIDIFHKLFTLNVSWNWITICAWSERVFERCLYLMVKLISYGFICCTWDVFCLPFGKPVDDAECLTFGNTAGYKSIS